MSIDTANILIVAIAAIFVVVGIYKKKWPITSLIVMTVVLLSLGYAEHVPYAATLAFLPGFALVVWVLLERDNMKAQKRLIAYHRGVMDERARAEAEKKRNE
jgi:hypothetical protein